MATAPTVRPAGRSPAQSSSASPVATIEEIRAQFPALERTHNGQPVAYFDGPGGTQVPRMVAEAVTDYLFHHNANTHWNYPTSAETDAMIESARTTLAEFVGGDAGEIVFGANATTLAFRTSRTIGRLMKPDDELIITELDHHANVGPWQALALECGCPLRVVKMDVASGMLDWDDFEQKVNSRTKLIAVGAASNALGTINDLQRASKLARSVGAMLFVDAVHYVPHHLADVRALDCDFLVCSAYKFYGPHIGAMWCRRELLESLPFPKLIPAPDTAPDRAETGTLNHEGIAGAAAAVDFIASLVNSPAVPAGSDSRAFESETSNTDGKEIRPRMGRLYRERRRDLETALAAMHERCSAFTRTMWDGLGAIDGVRLYGPPPEAARTSTVAFTVRGVPSSQVATKLAERGVFVSHGNFYAHTVVERLGLGDEGLVRAGCACYTTAEEVDRLVAGVSEIAEG